MGTTHDYFTQSQLAFASYAVLAAGTPSVAALTDERTGMSEAQARAFAENWTVVDQFTDSSSGASATILRKEGQLYLAIRGTQFEAGDLLADGLLALGVSSRLNPQFSALKAKLDDEWLAEGGPLHVQTFTVTGHSLGGYLAEAIKEQYSAQVTDAYLFNAPGSGGLVGNIANLVSDLFNQSSPGANGVWNIKASEGTSFITGLGSQSSAGIPIQIEAAPGLGLGNHSIVRLTDALAIQTLYSELAPSLTQAQLNALVDASGNPMNQTLESALDALRILLLGSGTLLTEADNRDAFYANLYSLMASGQYTGLAGASGTQLTVLAGASASSIAASAGADGTQGLAVRYALKALNPFALTGADYAPFNADGHLSLYDAATQPNGMTEQYLADRATFLERKLWFSIEDIEPVNPSYQFEGSDPLFVRDDKIFIDGSSGYEIRQGSVFPNTHVYAFGGNGADVLRGQSLDDRLYGGAGSDMLVGGPGDGDYLEGGTGMDVYQFAIGDGQDTVMDADGKGVLIRNGAGVALGVKQSEGIWTLGGATFTRTANGKDLELVFTGTPDDKITIRDFDFAKASEGSYLGIRLVDLPAAPAEEVRQFLGDRADWDSDGNSGNGVQTQLDAFGNVIRADGQGENPVRPDIDEPDRADVFTGSAADEVERFLTGGGNDVVFADGVDSITTSSGGRDYIDAGAGNDLVAAGGGNDWVIGGNGEDVLLGGAGDDVLFAVGEIGIGQAIGNGNSDDNIAARGDFLAGGAGRDLLIGSAARDVLSGGAGADIIIAGAGDDSINGDGPILSATLDWTVNRVETDSGANKTFTLLLGDVVNTSDSGIGGADVIYAGKGDDWVYAGAGDDYVDGSEGKDVLFGEEDDDTLIGGAGEDFLSGGVGDDYLDGGAGEDTLLGGEGNDFLVGGEEVDTLVGGDGNDILDGGAGNDVLRGGAGKDTYVFNRGDDREDVFDTSDTANVADASVVMFGSEIVRGQIKFRVGSLVIDAGEGDEIHIGGFDPNDPLSTPVLDSIQFSDGTAMTYQDVLDQGFDLDGTEGDDFITGTAVTDRISGFGGNDTLIGGAGNDTILGGEGNDDIDAGAGDDVINGGAGHDIIDGGEGNDTLVTSGGSDFAYGGAGDDAFFATNGDTVIDTEGVNTLDLTAWNDLTTANLEITQFETADGEQYLSYHIRDDLNPGVTPATGGVSVERGEAAQFATVTANDGAGGTAVLAYDTLMSQYAAQGFVYKGADSAETLEGTAFDDTMQGFGGEDTLNAGAGNDRLDGGAGNDTLDGGAGDDTYLLSLNGGRDTVIEDGNAQPGSIHAIQLDAGITSSMVAATQVGNDLVVSLRATADALVLKDFYLQPQAWQDNWTVKDAAEQSFALEDFLPVTVPPAEDWLDEQKDAFRARREQVYAANRQSEGWAALGGNTFQSVTQQHYYDTRQSTSTTGTRALVIENEASDSASIIAGAQFTSVIQTATNASFVIGQPSVRGLAAGREGATSGFGGAGAPGGSEGEFIPAPLLGNPGVQGRQSGTGFRINPGDLVIPVYGPNVGATKSVIRNAGSAGYANAGGFGDPGAWVLQGYRVYRAGSAAIGNEGAVPGQAAATVTNTTVDQKLTVADLSAGDSANVITVGDASVVEGGGGNDTIVMSSGYFFAGPDWERALNPSLQFGNPSTTSFGPRHNTLGGFADAGAGEDSVTGSEGQDTIAGGEGDDTLDGRAGSDRYLYAADETGIDTLSDSGLDARSYLDQYYWRQGILNWEERATHPGLWRGGQVNLEQYFATQAEAIDFVENNDVSQIVEFIAPLPSSAPLLAQDDAAALEQLMIDGVLDRDVVEFGPGLTLEDLSITLQGNGTGDPLQAGGTLSVRWNGGAAGFDTSVSDAAYGFVGADLLTEGAFDPEQQAQGSWRGYRLGEGIEEFRFADGSRYSLAQLLAVPQLSFGEYTFLNQPGEQLIDRRYDTVAFESGLSSFGLQVARDGIDLIFTLPFDDAQGRIVGWFADPDDLPQTSLNFEGGASIDAETLTQFGLQVQGTEGNDALAGLDSFENVISGNGGDDVITGGSGTDELVGGDGDDTVDGGGGDDNLEGGQGRDIVTGGSGADELFGGDGDDTVDGGDGEDYLLGGLGLDILRGGAGGDELEDWEDGSVLEGGAGDDFISNGGTSFVAGGTGDDFIEAFGVDSVVAFNAGDGADTVYAGESFTLSLGGGIAAGDLVLSQDGEDLVLAIGATDSIRLTREFEADPQAWPQITLQLFGSVHTFDVNGVIAAFQGARAADPQLQIFPLGAILEAHRTGFSETEALGGALAWQYATTGSLDALSEAQIREVLGEEGFGAEAQPTGAEPPVNHAPVVSAADSVVFQNRTVQAASLFSVADADGDAIVQYEFWDNVAGGGYFSLNGVQQGAGQAFVVSAADLANAQYVGGSGPGVEQVGVRAFDGSAWGEWRYWNVTSAPRVPNAAPVVTMANAPVLLNGTASAASLFSATDADDEPVLRFEFFDNTPGGGHFTVDGMEVGVNVVTPVPAAELADIVFVASDSIASDQVWVRAYDGQSWGDWKSGTIGSWLHIPNAVPVVAASNANVLLDDAVAVASLFSATDADNDPILRYEFKDSGAGGGHFAIDGVDAGAQVVIPVSAAQLANTQYVAGSAMGVEKVGVRVSDGMGWGAWQFWNITSALHIPNAAPQVTAVNSVVLVNDTVAASNLFSVTDADNDVITHYEFWDKTSGNGHFMVNGVQAGENVAIPVSAADLANTEFVAAGAFGSDQVLLRVSDGMAWSSFKSWTVTSVAHLTNAAPVVSAANNGLLRGETVSAANLFGVTDADGDPILQYKFWDDVNGGGQWRVDGVPQAAGQAIVVAAADLADTVYVGGANPGTEQVRVMAFDGMAWSGWKTWLMSTEGGLFRGGVGPDTLTGDPDTPILQGGGSGDTLTAGDPNSLLDGGEGADTLNGGAGNDLLIGGAGDDILHTGGGSNLIAYNAGDGADTLYSGAGSSNTLSLGGGLRYQDLSLSKLGNDLVLDTGGGNQLTFKDWYAGHDDVLTLQMVIDASADFDAGSSDPLANKRVQSVDFAGMVSAFDTARAGDPGLSSWALTNALLQYHLAGADEAALGGDLAYQYGSNDTLAGIGLTSALDVLASGNFGALAQQLRPMSGLQEGFSKLG